MKKNKQKKQPITIHFLPFSEIEKLGSTDRIKKLLDIILSNKIIIIQGRLKPEEETRLIEDTMIMVGKVSGFKGIELAVITPDYLNKSLFDRLKRGIANALIGQTDSLTVIGPASVIKEMKKDPKKLEVMMSQR